MAGTRRHRADRRDDHVFGHFHPIVRDGQLVGGWDEFDRLGLLVQLAEAN